jgi:hypothetical protein
MYKLQFKRCITSVYGWFDVGEFESLEDCVLELYCHYWLDARVYGPNGEEYSLGEQDYSDEDGAECVSFYFTAV